MFLTYHWRHYVRGKRSETSQVRGGRLARHPGSGLPRQGYRRGPPREGSSLAGMGTRREGSSHAEERGHQRQGRRERPHRGRGRQSLRKNGRGRDRLRGSSRRAEGKSAAPRERGRGRGRRGEARETQERKQRGDGAGAEDLPWRVRGASRGRGGRVAAGASAGAAEGGEEGRGGLRSLPLKPPGNGSC